MLKFFCFPVKRHVHKYVSCLFLSSPCRQGIVVMQVFDFLLRLTNAGLP
jgi:hypothetical protein